MGFAAHSATRVAALVCGLALGLASPCVRAALPDEIQVYVDDLNDPGKYGLQLHLNSTPSGRTAPDYQGESVAAHATRFTFEPSYGLTPNLEAGAYLPFVLEPGGSLRAAGFKIRLKWVPLRPAKEGSGFFAGANGELGQVQTRYESNRRSFELRPILGWRNADWLLATNPTLTFVLRGPDTSSPPGFEPSYKVSRTVARGIATGLEYYTDVGPISDIEPASEQKRVLYWAIDIDRKPWNINFGIGRGMTTVADRWTVKMIIDIPLGN